VRRAVPLAIIGVAELSFYLNHRTLCIALHAVNVLYIVALIMFREDRILSSYLPLSTFRIVNLSMPVMFPMTIYWLTMVYVSTLPSLFYAVKALKIEDLGLGLRRVYLLPLSIPLGYLFGLAEYGIYGTGEITSNLLLMLIFSYLIAGLVEEMTFRSILQNAMEREFGSLAVPISALAFALMNIREFPLMFVFGLVLGVTFLKTRNLLINVVMNGTATLFAFGLLPTGIGFPRF